MIEFYLIRHGKTYGNTLGRYIGKTDESLCPEGIMELEGQTYPQVEAVYVSPMKRCVETAQRIWPGLPMQRIPKLRECSFGDFENKNYLELADNPDYQAWVDSSGSLPFPGGESREAFRERCREGFREVLEAARQQGSRHVGLVIHGGTIMSILEAYALPHGEFYHWQAKNGRGYRVCWDERDEGGITLYGVEPVGADSGLCAGSDLR